MKLTINKSAADILTTDCAHVWRGQDVNQNGMGTWLQEMIEAEHPDLPEGLKNIEISGGINLRLIKSKDVVTVLDADYVPLNGVRVVKIVSFGKSGVSYFVNSHEIEGKPPKFSLTKVLYPSKNKTSVSIDKSDVDPFLDGITNTRGMAMCEFLLNAKAR